MNSPDPLPAAVADIARPKPWRRFLPAWTRALLWADAAARYDAFLSYSWKGDAAIAPVLQSVLQQFLRPWYKLRAKTVFRDLSSLPAGSSLERELFDRLDRSTNLIVLACPQAAKSDGMELEARYWFSKPRQGQVLIVVTEAKAAGWAEIRDNLLPLSIRLNLGGEPLWISVAPRRGDILAAGSISPHLREALVEDLAQVFLCLYHPRTWEELRGEERLQRRRALGLVCGAALVFLFLAAAAVRFARDAREERNTAVRQAEIARAHQFTAQSELLRSQSPANLPIAVRLASEALARYPSSEIDAVLWRGLARLPTLAAEVTHGGEAVRVRYTPDGCCVATASADGMARVADASTGRELAQIRHSGRVWDVAFDRTGQWLASVGAEGTVRISDWRQSQTRWALQHEPGKEVRRAVFQPGGTLLATASEDRTARLWDVRTGKERARIVHQAIVWDVAFSPDGTLLATGARDKRVKIWDCRSHQLVSTLHVSSIVWQVAFNMDGTLLAAGTDDGTAYVWRIAGNHLAQAAKLTHGDRVMALQFSPDGRHLVTTSNDQTIRIWSVPDFLEVRRIPGPEFTYSLAFNREGDLLAIAGKVAQILDFSTGEEVNHAALDTSSYSVAFSPRERSAAIASGGRAVRIWKVSSGRRALLRQADRERNRNVPIVNNGWAAASDPSGACIVIGSPTGTALAFHSADGTRFASLPGGSPILSVAAASGCSRMATGSGDGRITLWTPDSGSPQAILKTNGPVLDVAFNRSGTALLSASEDKTVRLWDPQTGRLLRELAHSGPIHAAYFLNAAGTRILTIAPGDSAVWDPGTGQRLAALSKDESVSSVSIPESNANRIALSTTAGRVSVRDSNTGAGISSFETGAEVWSIALSPDQTLVATAPLRTADATLWSVPGGKPLARLAHSAHVAAVAFDPSGRFLATGTVDGAVRVWSVEERRAIVEYRGASGIGNLRFTADGARLLIGFSDGWTEAIPWRTQESLEIACQKLRAQVFAAPFLAFVGPSFSARACP